MDNNISPLPWKLVTGEDIYDNKDDYIVCVVEANNGDDRANAAFIVKAVNHHDQLVQVVKDLLEYAGIIEERCDSVATDAARAALAAVEAQP